MQRKVLRVESWNLISFLRVLFYGLIQITMKFLGQKTTHPTPAKSLKISPASGREIILLIAGRIYRVSAVPPSGRGKKEGGFRARNTSTGTEPNGKRRLNYRLRRILRVCTAARHKRCSCRVCLSTRNWLAHDRRREMRGDADKGRRAREEASAKMVADVLQGRDIKTP